MKTVLLDTNFLIDLGRFGVSIDEIGKLMNERYELAVLRSTLNELKGIAGTQQEESKFAKVALMLTDLRGMKIFESEKTVDEGIVEAVQREKDVLVATNDVELKKRLKDLGVKTIYLRGKKHLAVDYQ
ncbi:MAG TPA: hypothetical protein VJJ76_01915 [archaeon]|nr:hypothetical protein [archaeon]